MDAQVILCDRDLRRAPSLWFGISAVFFLLSRYQFARTAPSRASTKRWRWSHSRRLRPQPSQPRSTSDREESGEKCCVTPAKAERTTPRSLESKRPESTAPRARAESD